MRFIVESIKGDKDTYYRLSISDYYGDNIGGLFTAIWNIVYGAEDDELIELEDLIDDLQSRHTVPSEWLGEDIQFAFTKKFFDTNNHIINRISDILSNWGYKLCIDKVSPTNVVYRDVNQIAYKKSLSERMSLLSNLSNERGLLERQYKDDLRGKQFGELTVIEPDNSQSSHSKHWICKCSCGKIVSVERGHLLDGTTKSCGHGKRQSGLDHYEDNFKGMRDRQSKYNTNLEVIRNQKMQPNNTSGIKGVDYHKGRKMWRGRVSIGGKELTKWSKDKDVVIQWRKDAIEKYYKPKIDAAIKNGDLTESLETFYIGKTEVLKNPSDNEFRQLYKEQQKLHPGQSPLLRQTYGEFGNYYVWPAFDSTHYNIELGIYKKFGERTNQNKNYDLFNHYYLDESIEHPFPNSKVKQVVYHTSNKDFDKFDSRKKGSNTSWIDTNLGYFFSDNEEITKQFGTITKAYYINLRKPLDLRIWRNISAETFEELNEAEKQIVIDLVKAQGAEPDEEYIQSIIDGSYDFDAQAEIREYLSDKESMRNLRKLGYDGIIDIMDRNINANEYIVFNSNQIKTIGII